uniref:Interferon regulatory factor 2-binding protein 1 & 2 zinc finger domain-containing protein n=1 Tax=Parascaris univalens TaxID=6257 RepID=A0A915ASW5_PARUN
MISAFILRSKMNHYCLVLYSPGIIIACIPAGTLEIFSSRCVHCTFFSRMNIIYCHLRF